ncbi:MAG: hypothetical protein IJ386_04455, partial [Clostridia bacterium]|nr:hypothetical protein [Clostridia bacterium]
RICITVYDFSKFDCDLYFIDGCGTEPFFTVKSDFDTVIVEWDDYTRKAWYEYHKHYKNDLVIDTPDGEQTVEVSILVHENQSDPFGEGGQDVSAGVKCNGKEYWGRGEDYLWIDAFADLQKQLPDGIMLKCCLSCRHGNMCPVGNVPDELFCTKDLLIEKKSDLYFCTEDEAERKKRSRRYTSVCEDYQSQSEDYFTYNDYPFFLKDTP